MIDGIGITPVVDLRRTRNCLFLDLNFVDRNMFEKNKSGLHETPCANQISISASGYVGNCKCIWLEYQTRRISASNVTAGRMEHDGRCTGSVQVHVVSLTQCFNY